jgi:general stress protein 26
MSSVRWDEFERACPEIATIARERFETDQLVMVGSLRKDGSPRISPCECDLADGRLFVSMMWRSRKALDLLRDPRVVVHSVTSDKDGSQGDVKLYGRIADEQDPEVRSAFRDAIRARIDWAPDEPNYHCFSVDVERAGYIRFGDDGSALAWDPERGLRRLRHPG